MSPRKVFQYPLKPRHIITKRVINGRSCPHSKNILEQCSRCGIGPENFVSSNLSAICGETTHSVTLIERVDCQFFNFNKENLSQEEAEKEGYYQHENSWYYYLNADYIKRGNESISTYNKEYNKECIYSRIRNAHNVFDKFNDKGNEIFDTAKSEKIVFTEGLHYKAYHCERSGFKEFIIPLYSDCTCKSIMAMIIIFGQIIIGNKEGVDLLHKASITPEEEKNKIMADEIITEAKEGKRYYPTCNAVFEKHGEAISRHVQHMQERVRLLKKDFLFEMLSELLKEYSGHSDIQSSSEGSDTNTPLYRDIIKEGQIVTDKIISLFKKIANRFDLRRCLLFMPNLADEAGMVNSTYNAHRILSSEIGCPQFNLNDTWKFNNEKIDAYTLHKSGHLIDYPFDEKSKEYTYLYGNRDMDCFIGIVIEWKEKENPKDVELHDTFFNTIVALARSTIMAFIAERKKIRLDEFSEQSRHDIAGKRAILDMHIKSFKEELLRVDDFIMSNEKMTSNTIVDFYIKTNELHEQMKIVYEMLGFLQRTLDTEELHEYPKFEIFDPKSRFISNFLMHFNNPLYRYCGGKRLHYFVKGNQPPHMNADAIMIERVLQNLLENAYKYAYDHTNIYLIYSFEQVKGMDSHVFKVISYGGGIDKNLSEKIFDYGQQGGLYDDGKGQGLPIARKFAQKNHNGTVELTRGVRNDGDTIDNPDMISPICVPLIPLAEYSFAEKSSEEAQKMIATMREERKRLSDMWNDDSIKSLKGKSIYGTVLVEESDLSNDFIYLAMKQNLNRPTYIVEFTVVIPYIKSINAQGDE